MADIIELKEGSIEDGMEIKVEPMQCYMEEEHENGFPGFENGVTMPSPNGRGQQNLWTSKATTCLITQYKKYRSMVGQTTQLRSLREMFEMISLEMQNYGYFFSPQKCENKWRVLERKYKNLVFRKRLKKPGRMRHYGHWEHKQALDEIFTEKRRHMFREEDECGMPTTTAPAKYTFILPKPVTEEQTETHQQQMQEDPTMQSMDQPAMSDSNEEQEQTMDPLVTFFEKFLDEMKKGFAIAEKNREKRHMEEMAIRQSELEVQKKLLKLKEQKLELKRCQMIAAAQYLGPNM